MNEKLEWKISVPIFKNDTILNQLAIAIGIPFGSLLIFFLIIKAYYGLMTIGILLFFTWMLVMIMYGGKYDVEFVLNNKGALCKTQKKQAKKNRVINVLTVILGVLSGKPAVAGAGMLAHSSQQVFVMWDKTKKAKYKPKSNTIILKGGFAENIAIFCKKENYFQIENFVKENLKGE